MTATWRDRLILGAPMLGVMVLALLTPSEEGPTWCPFALGTGMACPGCGMTRAAATLIRGDVGGAATFHPLVFLIGLQLIAGWIWYVLRRAGRVRPMRQRTLNLILIATALALVAVWLARLLTGALPPV